MLRLFPTAIRSLIYFYKPHCLKSAHSADLQSIDFQAWIHFKRNVFFHFLIIFYEWARGSCLHNTRSFRATPFCLHGNGSFPGSIAAHRALILLPPREEKMNLMRVCARNYMWDPRNSSGGVHFFFLSSTSSSFFSFFFLQNRQSGFSSCSIQGATFKPV